MSKQTGTVLITGCSTGFGREMVETFLARGWTVFSTLRRLEERQESFASLLSQHPERLKLLELDVTKDEDRRLALTQVEAHGSLDCLVNNAGYGLFGALENLSEDQLRLQFETNVLGAAFVTRTFLPLLREARGSVVFLSSAFGLNGFPLTAGYCASKFALEGLAESLHYELAPHGVRVQLIEPGANVTGFGANVQWGVGDVEAYRAQTQGYQALKKKIAARGTNNSARIATKIADFAQGSSWTLRRPDGSDAWLGALFRAFTPGWFRDGVSRRMYRRLFSKLAGQDVGTA